VAGKLHILKTTEYQYGYLKKAADQAKLDGGTRMTPPPTAPTTDSNVITAYNDDTVTIKRGWGVAMTNPLRSPANSEMLSRFMGRKAVKIKRAFINTSAASGGGYPGDGHNPGPLAIAYEAIPPKGIGRIVVAGPAYAYIDILETPAAIAAPHATAGKEGILAGRTQGLAGCRIIASSGAAGAGWALVDVGSYVSPYASMYRCQLKANLLSGTGTILVDNLVPYDGIATTYDPTAEKTATNFLALSGDNNDSAVIRYSATDDRWDLLEVTC